jgi:hypothetical protein
MKRSEIWTNSKVTICIAVLLNAGVVFSTWLTWKVVLSDSVLSDLTRWLAEVAFTLVNWPIVLVATTGFRVPDSFIIWENLLGWNVLGALLWLLLGRLKRKRKLPD